MEVYVGPIWQLLEAEFGDYAVAMDFPLVTGIWVSVQCAEHATAWVFEFVPAVGPPTLRQAHISGVAAHEGLGVRHFGVAVLHSVSR